MAEINRDDILDYIRRLDSPDKPETESEAAARFARLLARAAAPADNGPARFAQLTEDQRAWIASKSKADLEKLDDMVRDYDAAKLLGRAGKWLVVFLMTVFGGAFAMAKFGFDIFKMTKGS